MKSFTLNIFLLLICYFSNGQDFINKIHNDDVQIHSSVKWNKNPPSPKSIYSFDTKGNIQHIYKGLLNPNYKKRDYVYCAQYNYSENGKLLKELIYEIGDSKTPTLFRTTNYSHNDSCTIATVKSIKNGEIIGVIKEFSKDGQTIKKIIEKDFVLGNKGSSIHNSVVNYSYSNNKLKEIILKSENSKQKLNIKFNNKDNKKSVNTSFISNTISTQDKLFRFYDKKGRLIKISLEDNIRKWNVKFCYGSNGIINKIVRKAKTVKTNKKVNSSIIFKTKFSDDSKGKIINTDKINTEIINMYYPISGQANYLNFLDSRRFISHHG